MSPSGEGSRTTPPPELSIVIPAYNEARRLPRTLARIRAWLEGQSRSAEIIVVDDGSTDGTAAVLESSRAEFANLRLIAHARNRGKGASVRTGFLEARGRIVLVTDADLSAPIAEADKLLAALGSYDAAIGSRAVDRSLIEVHQSRARELAGILFNFAVRVITGLPFVDTQCGFKAFLRERAQIAFEQQRTEGFGFDPELLFLCRRHGLEIVEVPVRWAHDADTRVRVLRDGLRMVWDLLAVRGNWLLRRYPRA